jgi:hypothetical protein
VAVIRTQEAAAFIGKSRTTVWRAIKSGRLSAARTESGDFEIEVAELERVFGQLAAPKAAPSTCAAVVETIRVAWAERLDDYAKAATPVTSAQI